MARTIRTKVYKFDELNQTAKDKAIEQFNDINVDYDWWTSTYEDAANIGLKITSFDLDRYRHAKGEFTLAANEVAQNILNNHGEECETYKTAAAFMEEWQPIFGNYMDENHADYESNESEVKLMDIENDFLTNILEDYSIMLQKECEYLQSEAVIIETIQSNEYEFTADGRRF
jgi:hypothetical protein